MFNAKNKGSTNVVTHEFLKCINAKNLTFLSTSLLNLLYIPQFPLINLNRQQILINWACKRQSVTQKPHTKPPQKFR